MSNNGTDTATVETKPETVTKEPQSMSNSKPKQLETAYFPLDKIVLGSRRRVHNPSAAEIKKQAASIATNGQQQPVKLRKLDDGTLRLVFGYGRYEAIQQHNVANPKSKLTIWGTVETMTDEQELIYSIIENKDRKQTDAVDDAYNQEELRKLGKSDKDIAGIYNISAARVGQIRKILSLSKKIQDQIGKPDGLAVDAAIALADQKEEEREALLESAKAEQEAEAAKKAAKKASSKPAKASSKKPGKKASAKKTAKPKPAKKVSKASVKKAVRKKNETAKAAGKATQDEKVSRTMKDLRTFIEEETSGPAEPEGVKAFGKALTRYLDGTSTDRQYKNFIERIVESGYVTN